MIEGKTGKVKLGQEICEELHSGEISGIGISITMYVNWDTLVFFSKRLQSCCQGGKSDSKVLISTTGWEIDSYVGTFSQARN